MLKSLRKLDFAISRKITNEIDCNRYCSPIFFKMSNFYGQIAEIAFWKQTSLTRSAWSSYKDLGWVPVTSGNNVKIGVRRGKAVSDIVSLILCVSITSKLQVILVYVALITAERGVTKQVIHILHFVGRTPNFSMFY